MNSHHLRNKIGRVALALVFMTGIGLAAGTAVQAQWPQWPNGQGQDPYRRGNDRYGQYGNISQVAFEQGIQDGQFTGSRDAQRGQNYDPQRSHFYRNGHGDNGGYGRIQNSYQYQQAYRSAFLRGYQQGYQRYGGYNNRRNNNGRNNNGRWGRWPF